MVLNIAQICKDGKAFVETRYDYPELDDTIDLFFFFRSDDLFETGAW